MFRRIGITVGIIMAIGLVALLIMQLGDVGDGQPDAGPIALSSDQAPVRFDPNEATRPIEMTKLERSEEMIIERADPESGRLIQQFILQRVQPRQEGEYEVDKPEARLFLSDGRVVRMLADSGYFVAPDRHPQSGRLDGNVRIQLFERDAQAPPRIASDSDDLALQIELESADFDATLGKIDSTGPVRVIAPVNGPRQLLFEGQGLTLVFNEPRNRIDYLAIERGRRLVYRPPAEQTDGSTGPAGASADPNAAEAVTEPADAEADAGDEGQQQYYRVVFDKDIRVSSGGRVIEADGLSAFFAASATDRDSPDDAPADQSATQAPSGRTPLGSDRETATAESPDNTAPLSGGEPIEVMWTGRMVLEPQTDPPAELDSPREVLIAFKGRPLRIFTEEGEQIIATDLQYLTELAEVTLTGSAEYPLKISSPGLGTIESEQLTARLDLGIGQLLGAGSLHAQDEADGAAGQDLPPGFSIQWAQRLDLAFSVADGGAGHIDRATFRGNVQLNDEAVRMRSDSLDARFAGVGPRGERQLQTVEARGNVQARTKEGEVEAELLRIATTFDAGGSLVPDLLTAQGDVRITDATQQIEAGSVEVELGPADNAPTPSSGKAIMADRRPTYLRATESVRVVQADGTRITADRLEADPLKRSGLLIGSPVVLERDGSRLQVLKLVLEDDGAVARADGSGEFDFVQLGANDQPSNNVHVEWTQWMNYDGQAATINLHGQVTAESSDNPLQQNQLSAEHLTMELIRTSVDSATGAEDELEKPLDRAQAVLRQVTASGDVELLATRLKDAQSQQIATRLLVQGPKLVFDNTVERAQVIGPGSMGIEDYRATSDADTTRPLTGRGRTAFTWTGGMTLYGQSTSLAIKGGVRMIHIPCQPGAAPDSIGEDGTQVQLACNRLVADMVGIGGMQAMRMSELDDLEIDHLEATGGVQIRDRRRMITADRAYYDGAEQSVLFEAEADRQVELTPLDATFDPIRTAAIIWFLQRDRVEVYHAGN